MTEREGLTETEREGDREREKEKTSKTRGNYAGVIRAQCHVIQ